MSVRSRKVRYESRIENRSGAWAGTRQRSGRKARLRANKRRGRKDRQARVALFDVSYIGLRRLRRWRWHDGMREAVNLVVVVVIRSAPSSYELSGRLIIIIIGRRTIGETFWAQRLRRASDSHPMSALKEIISGATSQSLPFPICGPASVPASEHGQTQFVREEPAGPSIGQSSHATRAFTGILGQWTPRYSTSQCHEEACTCSSWHNLIFSARRSKGKRGDSEYRNHSLCNWKSSNLRKL